MTLTKRQKLKKALAGNKKPVVTGLMTSIYASHTTKMRHYKTLIKNDKVYLNPISSTSWELCREILCESVVSALSQQEHYDWGTIVSREIYKHYTSLMFNEVSYENMKKGLRILHYFEKRAGFDLTFIKLIKTMDKLISNISGPRDTVYVCGPKEWTQSVPYLSLYTMILKLISKYPVKSGETAKKFFKRVIPVETSDSSLEYYLDDLLLIHPDIMVLVMKHYKELNDSMDYSTWKGDVDILGTEGINKLSNEANSWDPGYNWYGPHRDFIIILSELLNGYKERRCPWK